MRRILMNIALVILTAACSTEYRYEYSFSKPFVSNVTVDAVTEKSAILSGTVYRDGGQVVSERGFYLSTSAFEENPPSSAQKLVAPGNSGVGKFGMEIVGLSHGTTYYVCAYAVNEEGTVFSSTESFSTKKVAKVILGDTEVDFLSINKMHPSIDHEYEYNWALRFPLHFEGVESLVSAGVCVDGKDFLYDKALPASDDESIVVDCSTERSPSGDVTVSVYAFAEDKLGKRLVSDPRQLSLSTMGVSLRPYAEAVETDWYSEPGKGYYLHFFEIGVKVTTGASNITELGVFPSSTYMTTYFKPDYFVENVYYNTTEVVRSSEPEVTLNTSGMGVLKNGMNFYCWDHYTAENMATSTYGVSAGYEVYFSEEFADGLGSSFSAVANTQGSYTWVWDSSMQCAKANAYSSGSNRAANTSLVSKLIDLKNRTAAFLSFSAYAKYFTNVNEEVSLSVYSSKDNKWYPYSMDLTNDVSWEVKVIDLSQFLGDEIKLSFNYTSTEASCGSILLDNVEIFSSAKAPSASALFSRQRALQQNKLDSVNKERYENTRR